MLEDSSDGFILIYYCHFFNKQKQIFATVVFVRTAFFTPPFLLIYDTFCLPYPDMLEIVTKEIYEARLVSYFTNTHL